MVARRPPSWRWHDQQRRRYRGFTEFGRSYASPSQITTFVGSTLTAKQTLSWQPAGPNGSREGTLQIVPQGMPAKADGHASVRPDATGTEVIYTGTFTVSVPLVGKKLEKAAAPHITQAFNMQQDAGNDWLASH